MFYKSENEIMAKLRFGTPEERIMAICSMDSKGGFDLYLEIFLSDENTKVRCNALVAACYAKPEKLWEILEYVLKNDTKDNLFTRIVAKRLLEVNRKK